MKKTQLKPIAVSQVNPVYINNRIKYWHVDVRYAGDLALWHNEERLPYSLEEFKKYLEHRGWSEADMECSNLGKEFFKFKQENAVLYANDCPYVLNPKLSIPGYNKISTVKWDEKSKDGDNKYSNTLVGYMFRDGLFGRGAERAWCFRIKILARINENNK